MDIPDDLVATERADVRDAGLAPQSLGEALRLLRHRTRTSRDELSRLAKLSTGAISNYENEVSSPSARALRRLAVALAGLMGTGVAPLWEQLGQVLDRSSPGRD